MTHRLPPLASQEELAREQRAGPRMLVSTFFFGPLALGMVAGALFSFPHLVRWLAGFL